MAEDPDSSRVWGPGPAIGPETEGDPGESSRDPVASQALEALCGRPVGREHKLDGQFGGGHVERGVEGGEHAEERELAAVGGAHPEWPEDVAAGGAGLVLVLGRGVAGDLVDEGGEVVVAGDRDLPLEPFAKVRAPLA